MGSARSRRSRYYEITAARPPTALLVDVVESQLFPGSDTLDLGCGSGRDTAFLLSKGLKVTAVDIEESVSTYLKGLPNQSLLRFVTSDFERFKFKVAEYDLINAQSSLPFMAQHAFGRVMMAIKGSLRTNGIFIGQLFGNRHGSILPASEITLLSRTAVISLFSDMEVGYLSETEWDGALADGTPMHWHRFDILVRKV